MRQINRLHPLAPCSLGDSLAPLSPFFEGRQPTD